jgi:hypothetical protein
MNDWQPMESAPLETPIMVRMETARIKGGVWVATAIIHEDSDHWTDGATILHYNRDSLVRGFRGPLTGWMPLPAPLTARRG